MILLATLWTIFHFIYKVTAENDYIKFESSRGKIAQSLAFEALALFYTLEQGCYSNILVQKKLLEVFYKKDEFKHFTKLTETHLCLGLFLNKVAGLGPTTLLKKRL